LVERIDALFPIEPLIANYRGEVAERWRYRDGAGEIGFISSVTQPFCGDCSRARLSPEGALYTCLFASHGTDFRGLLRSAASDPVIENAVRAVWDVRDDRYSDLRSAADMPRPKIEMSYIGG
jgi:cyclic pyranopterin phosphate synthase